MIRSRYRRITFFFARVLLSLAVWELVLPRLGLRRWARRTRSERIRRSAAGFRNLAVQMGGVLIKVGQFFSSRVDVLPAEVTAELSGLQDEVPEESFADIRRMVEQEFSLPLEKMFARFNHIPLAAASLGQVHEAEIDLDDGENQDIDTRRRKVVVKVQRPGIENIINTDLAAMRTVGGWVNRYRPVRRRADVPALLEEFTRILNEEIDYLAEGKNAETFAQNFKDQAQVCVPAVFWSHTTRRVLTLEDVTAIKITDYEDITRAGVDRKEVARRLLDTYLKQIFDDGFFHADPHPGNLFVLPLAAPGTNGGVAKTGWQLTFVDFGMVGRMTDNVRTGLRELLVAVGTRDAARSVKAYQMLGLLLPGADLILIEKAEAEGFKRFYGKNMSELTNISVQEMRDMALEFRQLIYDLPFQVPEDLILLARTIGILSGMCTGLDPQFNVWESIAPYVEKMAVRGEKGRAPWLDILGGMARKLIEIPNRTDTILDKVERGELFVQDPHLTTQMGRVEKAINRAVVAIMASALFIGGSLLHSSGQIELGVAAFSASGFLFLITIVGLLVNRSSKE